MALWFTDIAAQLKALNWRQKIAYRAIGGQDDPNGLTDGEAADRLWACQAAEGWLLQLGRLGLGTTVAERKKVFEFIERAIKSPAEQGDGLIVDCCVIAGYSGGRTLADFDPCSDTS